MFEFDRHGTNGNLENPHLPGGVAASRNALAKQRYLEERQIRLAGEAAERRHQAFAAKANFASKEIGKLSNFARTLIGRLTMRRAGAK